MKPKRIRTEETTLIEWGVAASTLPGEAVSGDCWSAKSSAETATVAVMDGLGHGPEAFAASEAAVAALDATVPAPLQVLLMQCHAALQKTRGAVMSIARFNAADDTMTWLGIGNVEGVLCRANPEADPSRESLTLRGGVVGYQIPTLRESILKVYKGDVLVLATDGIRAGFADAIEPRETPQRIAGRILAGFGKGTDDALVFVARYRGGTA